MATAIVDGKTLEIRYVRPDVTAGLGDGTENRTDGDTRAWALTDAVDHHAAGMEIRFINYGSFTADTTHRSFDNDGTGSQPIIFSGRNASDTAYENAYLNRGAGSTIFNGKNTIVRYLDIVSSSSVQTVSLSNSRSLMYNCKILNTNVISGMGLLLYRGCAFNNYIESRGVIAHALSSSFSVVFGNKVISKYNGVYYDNGNMFLFHNLIIGNGVANGVYSEEYVSALNLIQNNTIYNFNYGINIYATNNIIKNIHIANNLFHTISGINNPSDPSACIALRMAALQSDYFLTIYGNRYYNCDNFMVDDKYDTENLNNNIECLADPFVHTDVNPSYDSDPPDYSLNNVTGGGVSCKNIPPPVYNWTWNH